MLFDLVILLDSALNILMTAFRDLRKKQCRKIFIAVLFMIVKMRE